MFLFPFNLIENSHPRFNPFEILKAKMTNIGITPLATKILTPLETNVSAGMFLRDTGGCLLSRLAVSRSKDETREISFVELAESGVFYFSITPIAALLSKIVGKGLKENKELLGKSLSEIPKIDKNLLDKVKIAKLGKIGLAFSILLPAIYAIVPLRNVLTESVTGKNEFTSVVGLNKKHRKGKAQKQKDQAKEKAIALIKRMAGYAALGATATLGFMAALKAPALKSTLEPAANWIIKHFDFNGKAGLSLKQLGFLIMPVSVKSYFDASRDKYEVLENVRRFAITIPMMFFGQDFIEKNIYKFFDKKFHSNLAQGNKITTYEDIMKMPVAKQAANLKAKNWAIALAFAINTMGLALAVGILNRISTKRNYQKEQQLNALSFSSHQNKNDVESWLNNIQHRQRTKAHQHQQIRFSNKT